MRRARAALFVGLLAAGCNFAGAPPGPAADSPDAGATVDAVIPVGEFRRPVLVSPPPLAGPLEDVPLAIRLTDDPHLAAQILPDGSDLFVLDQDGAQLALEIERLDSSNGTLVGWVILPLLPAGGTTIYLHYGGEAATGNDANPWDGLALLVWHMARIEGDVIFDSAPERLNGTRGPAGSITSTEGMFAGALEVTDAAASVETESQLNVASESFSLELWFQQSEALGENDTGFFNGGPTINRPGYQIELGTGDWSGGVRDDDGLFNPPEEYSVSFGSESALGSSGWHHLVMVLDRQAPGLFAYRDGALVDSSGINNLSSLRNTSDKARVGGIADLVRGAVDEVRLLSRPVSADWVAVDYANGTDTLLTIGPPEADVEN